MRPALILLATLTLATSAFAQNSGDSMSPVPQLQPQTFCLGRFLIDLPPGAEIVAQTAEYRWDKIEVKRQPSVEAFQKMIADKEKTLRETKHEKEPSLLKHISRSNGSNSVAMVFWEQSDSEYLYETEAFKWQKGNRYLLKGAAGDDRAMSKVEKMNRSLSELRYRDGKEIPAEPGFCIEKGLFAGEPAMPHYEYAEVSFRLKSHPDVVVSASTWMVMKEDREGLLDRIDRKKKDMALIDLFNRIKVLRRGTHPVGGMAAEEYLQSVPAGETFSTHMFRWETTGKYHDLYAPEIIVEFQTGKTKGFEERPPSVTDKQAIELFDSIVNSIRVRPVSAPPASPDTPPAPPRPQPTVPLGTVAPSLQPCPQSGLWECAAELAAGEKRQRYFPQGMILPTVIVRRPERTLLQTIKGVPPNMLAETTWTLVGYGVQGEAEGKGKA